MYTLAVNLRKIHEITDSIENFVPLLVSLCSIEEATVRRAAAETLVELARRLSKDDVFACVVPQALAMSAASEFAACVSSVSVLVFVYRYAVSKKKAVRA